MYGIFLVAVLLALAACGPEKSDSAVVALEDETVRIAQAFAQDGNADQARGRLQDLDVANPMQWLVYTTETAISERQDADDTKALARLAITLGSQSHVILDYGAQAGIISVQTPEAQAASVSVNAVSAHAAPSPVAVVEEAAQATPVAAPTVAVIVLEPTGAPASESATEVAPTPEPVAEESTPTAIPL